VCCISTGLLEIGTIRVERTDVVGRHGYRVDMASPAPRTPHPEPVAPRADPMAIRACLPPEVAEAFDAEWELVLEQAKQSKDLDGIRWLLAKWRHVAYGELTAPGTYARVQSKAEEILRSGVNPAAAPWENMQALIAERLGR
jgi:hypothetical protein